MALSFKNLDKTCEEAESCLAEKFSRLTSLSDEHRQLLSRLEDEKLEARAGEGLVAQGQFVEKFFVIKKGWAVSSVVSKTGRTTVIDIHHPGDIVGSSQMPFATSPFTCATATNAVLCPFPRAHLDDLLKTSPRLSGLLQSVSMIEHAILQDRIATIASEEAHIRLCHFLLQTFNRLKFMNDTLDDQFYCPLNQTVIGNAIGVTSVHASRMFARLSDMGLIERHRNFIKFMDWDRAVELSGFVDRYENVSLPWLPEK